MNKTAILAALVLSTLAYLPAASANLTSVCTPPSPPVGACVYATPGSWTTYYYDPDVGEYYYYTCDPWGLVCVLTPSVGGTYRPVTIPWIYVSATLWCTPCKSLADPGVGSDDVVLLA